MFIPSAKRAPRTLTLKVNGVINVHPKRDARPKTFILITFYERLNVASTPRVNGHLG